MNIDTERFPPSERKMLPMGSRPKSYWDVVVAHFPFALFCGLILVLPLWVSLKSLPLIDCIFLNATGLPCPFCGFTHSFWAISEGEWYVALRDYPLSLGIYILLLIFFIWHSAALVSGTRLKSGLYGMCKSIYLWWGIGAAFFLNWIYGLVLSVT